MWTLEQVRRRYLYLRQQRDMIRLSLEQPRTSALQRAYFSRELAAAKGELDYLVRFVLQHAIDEGYEIPRPILEHVERLTKLQVTLVSVGGVAYVPPMLSQQ